MKKFSNLQVEPQNEGLKSAIASGLAGLSMLISSCQSITPEEKSKLKHEIEILNQQEAKGKDMVNYYHQQSGTEQETLEGLDAQIKEAKKKLGILESGREPRYILKLKVQEHKFELSVDRIEFEFKIPVDEQFYNESEVGQQLGEGSRSFSIGHDVDITVVKKIIK
jgi:hypothetical protein